MMCKRCPHHIRHGQPSANGKSIQFRDRCGLKMKENLDCKHYPFAADFQYMRCDIYLDVFKSRTERNEVVPTQDIQYSEAFTSSGLGEIEIL